MLVVEAVIMTARLVLATLEMVAVMVVCGPAVGWCW